MADLKTSFMGIELKSPVIVGASTFSRRIDNIKRAEDGGAGALVIYSLFQEQIEMEAAHLAEDLAIGSESFAESLSYFPKMDHAGAREHVMWIEKTRKEVGFPLIGSLNATSAGNWVHYARQIESAGCNALELNLYSVEADPGRTCADIEKQSLDVVAAVKAEVKIPVAVKLSPWYTSVANFVTRVVEAGADGVVLFNRFYQPFINPDKETLEIRLDLSQPEDTRLPLRWIALLSGDLNADLAASTGVHSGKDVIRHILAGAKAAQCVSTLYLNGLEHITEMNHEITRWMDSEHYKTIDDFRGKLNQKRISGDPYAFERAQYINLLHEYKQK
ncbi:MAG: dihydroorotate dehydrogenase-like protein [Armatimonadetes bacterium]|nr:dihydroorotate dehydrogenase-like protein [Armatimonadota bacterium]